MMSQWNKIAKFHSEFNSKALWTNIRKEGSPKIFAKFADGFKYALQRWENVRKNIVLVISV